MMTICIVPDDSTNDDEDDLWSSITHESNELERVNIGIG